MKKFNCQIFHVGNRSAAIYSAAAVEIGPDPDVVDPDDLADMGLVIYTTLDAHVQQAAEDCPSSAIKVED